MRDDGTLDGGEVLTVQHGKENGTNGVNGISENGVDKNFHKISENACDQNPNMELGPDSVATLSFTSGSTGTPKGVRGRHYSLTHFYPWMKEEFEMTENERFTMLSGIAHDPIPDKASPIIAPSDVEVVIFG